MEHEPYLEEEHKDQLCKKDCKRIAGSLLFYYILLFACAFTLGIISSAYIMSGASQTELETITNIFSMIATCFVTILTLVIYKKKLHVTIPYSLCKEWNFLSILRYTIIAMGLSGAAGILIQLINQILIHFGWVMTTPDFSMKPDITYNLSIVLSACIIAPIMEELHFRGLILQTLKRYGNVFAILVTSLLFALLHGNLPQSVPVFALSMMICYVVLKSGSILPGIAIHFLNNAFAIMEVSLLSDNGQISTVFLILEALFLLYAMFTLYQKRLIIRNYIIHNRGSRVRTFFSNWISILFLVLCVFIMITSFQRT